MRRRSNRPDVHDLRDELLRIEDEDETSLSLSHFIEKHGPESWTDALFARMGPTVLMMSADIASLMETIFG